MPYGLLNAGFRCPLERCILKCGIWKTLSASESPEVQLINKAQLFIHSSNASWVLILYYPQFSSVTQSCPDSPWPHELQHTRLSCPSLTLTVHSDSHPSSQWCHPAISSSVIPFSSCPQSLPASESFPVSQLFAWGGQSTGVSASASILSKKSQGWSPSEWTGWISLQS